MLGSKNSALGPQKTKKKVEKIDFLKKPELLDLPESGFGYQGGPIQNVVYQFCDTIRIK